MATDPHMKAMELSAGTVALKAWVADQAQSNTALSPLQRLALGHIPDSIFGGIVAVVNAATDEVRDTNAPSQAQQQENSNL